MQRSKTLGIVLLISALQCAAPFALHAKVSVSTYADANISADTTSGTYTTLTGPVLDEGGNQDIDVGTIVLNAPAGFQFDSSAPVTVTVSRLGGSGSLVTLASSSATVTSQSITVTVTAIDAKGGGTKSSLTWSGIRVRPTAGTPLATGDVTASGTAAINGLSTGATVGTLTEVSGAAVRLAFATQPGNATAGAAFGIQPVVVSRDQFGNASTNGLPATANVTLTISTGSGTLQGTATLNIGMGGGRGTVSYVNLRIDAAGPKQLTAAASAGLTSATSATFSVSPAAASTLAIGTQPSAAAVAGVPFAQQPVVFIQDAYGNIRSNDTLTVTASRAGGAGTLQGTTNRAAVAGVAVFTDLVHYVASDITLTFSSGALTPRTSALVSVSPSAFRQLQLLLPGETGAPGTSAGKTGSPALERVNSPFDVTVNAVDAYWNLVGTNDLVHFSSTDSAATLPADSALANGTLTASVVNQNVGYQALNVSDLTHPSILGSTSAVYRVVPPGPVLPAQPDRTMDELTTLIVTNTATPVNGTNGASGSSTNSYVFNYSSRSALLSAGWSFIATAPDGTARNTEITNIADGALVDYNQTTHPGILRVPCDIGDLWAGANNSRNSLFRSLPANWISLRLYVSLNPTLDYQQVHVALYQDDDNFVQAGLAHNNSLGGVVSTLVWEYGAVPNHYFTAIGAVTSIYLRLDRDPLTGNVTGLYSLNGSTWVNLGQTAQALVNPRVCLWGGGSPVPYTNGLANIDLRRLDVVVSSNSFPTLTYDLIDGPAGASINANGIITWTPTESQGPSTNVFTTVVTETSGGAAPASSTNSFQVVVNEVNTAPSLPPVSNQILVQQQAMVVNNTAVDTDLPVNPLTYRLVTAPTNASISANGVISWTPAAWQVPSTNVFVTVVSDTNLWAINAKTLSDTNAFTVYVFTQPPPAGPVLPAQTNRVVNELALLTVTNTAGYTNATLSPLTTNAYVFTYANRDALLAAGWSFLASSYGTNRNTEVTNTAIGAVLSYDQTAHPGILRVPCDLGDLWGTANNTRNMLLRSLPAGWQQMTLSLAFAPNANVQQAHLVVYQDDDNYVQAGVAYNGGQKAAMDREVAAGATTLSAVPVSATSVLLRLERDPASGAITGSYSLDGVAWNILSQVVQSLTTPRVAIWVGGSQVPYTSGMPNCDLSRLEIVSSNTVTPVLAYQLINPPAGAAISTNGVITWRPTEAQGPGTNTLTTVVSDNSFPPLKDTNSFVVVVNEVNTRPVLPVSIPTQTLVGQSTLWFTNAATDADLPVNTLTYQLQTAPNGAAIGSSSGVITWTPSASQVPSTNVFVTVVTDNNPWALTAQHLSDTNTFTVVVNANPPGPRVSIAYNNLANTVQLTFGGIAGRSYNILWTGDVGGPWTVLDTVVADSSGQVIYIGPAPAATAYFRALGL